MLVLELDFRRAGRGIAAQPELLDEAFSLSVGLQASESDTLAIVDEVQDVLVQPPVLGACGPRRHRSGRRRLSEQRPWFDLGWSDRLHSCPAASAIPAMTNNTPTAGPEATLGRLAPNRRRTRSDRFPPVAASAAWDRAQRCSHQFSRSARITFEIHQTPGWKNNRPSTRLWARFTRSSPRRMSERRGNSCGPEDLAEL